MTGIGLGLGAALCGLFIMIGLLFVGNSIKAVAQKMSYRDIERGLEQVAKAIGKAGS